MDILNKFPKAKSIVLWENPKKTGAIAGGATFAYYVLEMSGYTMISLFSNILLLVVIGAFLWHSASRFMSGSMKIPPRVPELDDSTARELSAHLQVTVNKVGAYSNRVLSGAEPILTLKSAGVLYMTSRFGGWFHFWTLCYMAIFLALTVPKVYILKQREIDQLLGQASRQIGAYVEVLKGSVTGSLNKGRAHAPTKSE